MANEERVGTPPYLKDRDGHIYPYNSTFVKMAGMVPLWELPKPASDSGSVVDSPVEETVAPLPAPKTLTLKK